MKAIWPALALAVLLWPVAAQAQGYPGVMSPQEGYRPPAQTQPAPQSAGASGFGSPYVGTGASDDTGYYAPGGDDGARNAQYPLGIAMPAIGDDDDGDQAAPQSPFQAYFAVKPKEDDDTAGSSIYDAVDTNGSSPVERRRQAIIRKIEMEQRKAQREMQRANERRAAEVRAMVQKTVDDQRKKANGDDADGAADDQSADDGAPDQPDNTTSEP